MTCADPTLPSDILVVGAGGLLGHALVARGCMGLTRAELDVTNRRAFAAVLDRLQPKAVIFAAAQTRVDAAHLGRDWAVGVEAPAWCARQVPTWFISSNYVFSGPGPHLPGDEMRPLLPYGQLKRRAELEVCHAGGSIVRTGWFYGPGGTNFGSRLPHLLAAGEVKALVDWPVQPTHVDDLAQRLLWLEEGISHAISHLETTWFDVARACCAYMGYPMDRVSPLALADFPTRPADVRLGDGDLAGWNSSYITYLFSETPRD